MDPIIIGAALALVGTFVTVRGSNSGQVAQVQAQQNEQLSKRVTALEESFDEERKHRMKLELQILRQNAALRSGLGDLRNVAEWLSRGAPPPPPDVQQSIVDIESAINAAET